MLATHRILFLHKIEEPEENLFYLLYCTYIVTPEEKNSLQRLASVITVSFTNNYHGRRKKFPIATLS